MKKYVVEVVATGKPHLWKRVVVEADTLKEAKKQAKGVKVEFCLDNYVRWAVTYVKLWRPAAEAPAPVENVELKPEFTPGLWIRKGDIVEDRDVLIIGKGWSICTVHCNIDMYMDGKGQSESQANLLLIQHAPDLFNALVEVLKHFDDHNTPESVRLRNLGQAVINKILQK